MMADVDGKVVKPIFDFGGQESYYESILEDLDKQYDDDADLINMITALSMIQREMGRRLMHVLEDYRKDDQDRENANISLAMKKANVPLEHDEAVLLNNMMGKTTLVELARMWARDLELEEPDKVVATLFRKLNDKSLRFMF
jgi:2-hydroxychromene-2-carboxylate isomerase